MTRHAVLSSGIPASRLIGDARPGASLAQPGQLTGAAYVDNYAVFGHEADKVSHACDRISAHLRARGLVVHELADAAVGGSFIGLEVHANGRTAIKRERLWRLRQALVALLHKGFFSGVALRILLGHIAWAGMLRRGVLALLSSAYAFCAATGSKAVRLWPSIGQIGAASCRCNPAPA